jgi:hypothetical protein
MRRIGRRVVMWLVVAAMCALPVQGFALTVNTNDIADGAVTDAKITGPISATKIADGVFQKKYANVIVVAKSGGDFTDPVAAVNSITNASVTNPYLVKIMPGIYGVGATSLIMKDYVDIEGSGQNVTKIVGDSPALALVMGASNSEIRLLTLNASNLNNATWVMWCSDGCPSSTDVAMIGPHGVYVGALKVKLNNVNIVANSAYGYAVNSVSGNTDIIVNNSTISSNGVGIGAYGGAVQINNSTISINGDNGFGVGSINTDTTILNSQISVVGNGTYGTVFNSSNAMISGSAITSDSSNAVTGSGTSVVKINNTSLNGYPAIYHNGQTIKCLNVFDADLNPIACN